LQKCDVDCYGKCQNKIHTGTKCILHCEKNSPNKKQTLNDVYQKDKNTGLLSDFYDSFLNYTVAQIFEHTELINNELTKEDIKSYFESSKFNNEKYNKVLKKITFRPYGIHFPTRKGNDDFDYLKIFNLFEEVFFDNCEFYIDSLELKDTKCLFEKCVFNVEWMIDNYTIHSDEKETYFCCTFNGKVSSYSSGKENIYDYPQFNYSCTFNENLELTNCTFKNKLFTEFNSDEKEIKTLKLLKFDKCIFEERTILNDYNIDGFSCVNTTFNDMLEFNNNTITDVLINNSEFKNTSSLMNSIFTNLIIKDSVFEENVDFKDSVFGIKNKLTEDSTTLKSVLIKKSINFRNVKFYYGLDIPDTKINDLSNFLKADLTVKYTPQDTYRRLKYEFDSIGNIIEANKFYQKEMEKREEDLKKELPKDFFEWVIFKIHGFTSGHSQNALLALFWIFIISYIYSYTFNFLDVEYMKDIKLDKIFLKSFIYDIYSTDLFHLFMLSFLMTLPYISANSIINKNYYLLIGILTTFLYMYLTKDFTLSIVSNNINPFSIITEAGELSFDELLYRVTIAYLLYQLVISIRQNTRRK